MKFEENQLAVKRNNNYLAKKAYRVQSNACTCKTRELRDTYIYLRLDLHEIIYVQICLGSDPLWYGNNLFTQDWFKLEQYGSIWDHLHKWIQLVPESRSDPYLIH